MLSARPVLQGQESELMETTKTIAMAVTQELVLALEDTLMTQTLVGTRQNLRQQTTETSTSKAWDTFWCSEMELNGRQHSFDNTQLFEIST